MLGIKLLNANIADAPKDMNLFDERYFRAKLTFGFSDAIVGNSQAGLEAYRAPGIKSHCVYNGFDFDRISHLEDTETVRQGLGIDSGKLIGMVGAFFDRKDYDTFIRGACLLLRDRKDLHFLAIGDGPNLAHCQSIVPEHFRAHIHFPGMLHRVESVINLFDVGVLCTNASVHGEGISNSILEYMVLGKPVVATLGGGTSEIVIDGETGWLVPPADPEALAGKIADLLDHPDKALGMGNKGRERIYSQFSIHKMEQTYLGLYSQLTGLPLIVSTGI
jgi:glycosyltransferase involved in cell wall biosynthesis